MEDEEGQHTFRKWNPEKVLVPYGRSTDAESSGFNGNWLCCFFCNSIDLLLNEICPAYEEVVDCVKDTKMSAEAYFDSQAPQITTPSLIIRPLAIQLLVFGLFILFMPCIELLNWIPFVNWLLDGTVAVAAIMFALLVGVIISGLVISIAWVFYKPLVGVLSLIMLAISVYFIVFFSISTSSDSSFEE